MPYSIRTADGIVINNIPDDIPEDHPSLKQRVSRERTAMKIENDPISQGARNFAKDMPFTDKFNAGIGKAFTDIGRGAGQMVGMGPSAAEVRETRQLDAPLMNTGAGLAGNVAGNIAALAPLAVLPGGATVAGAGAAGLTAGALQPAESTGQRFGNMAIGGGLGAGTQALAGPVAQRLGEAAASRQAAAAGQQSRNAVRDETLQAGHEAGFVVPPSAINQPSFIGGRLESLGGKAALGQESSLRNQEVTDTLARRASGLGSDEALSIGNLKQARHAMSAPYREVSALSPQAAMDLEAVKAAKLESKLQWAHHLKSGDPNAYKAAVAADQQAEAALNRIDSAAQSVGRPDLVQALKQARVSIAQNHEVRNALNAGSGSADAAAIGRSFDRNPEKFSGDLKTIGAFQQTFPQYMRSGEKVGAPGVGKTELLAAALLGGAGYGTTDSPYGAAAGLLPFASGAARSALLSRPVQDAISNPKYSAGMLTNKTAQLADPETRRRLALTLRAGVPAAVGMQQQ